MQFFVEEGQHLGYFYDRYLEGKDAPLMEDKEQLPGSHLSYTYLATLYKADVIKGNISLAPKLANLYRKVSLRPYIEQVRKTGNY